MIKQNELYINDAIIKSISYNQEAIISNIIELHCPGGIELDPTYGRGLFYKGSVPRPKYCYDSCPYSWTIPERKSKDCRNIPLQSNSISSIMFDPPFIGGQIKDGKPSIMKSRFSSYDSVPALWEMYQAAIVEFKRLLIERAGILIIKTQDTIENHTQYLSSFKIISICLENKLYPLDVFVLLSKDRPIQSNLVTQVHARKCHSYFLVFKNMKKNVPY